MASIFTKIINGEIPCYKIGETPNCFAFLDIYPLAFGHTLVIPKKEVDFIYDLNDEILTELTLFAKKIANVLKTEVNCARIGQAVVGLEVPHAHIHLIPINSISDIDFSRPKLTFSAEKMESLAQKLSSKLCAI